MAETITDATLLEQILWKVIEGYESVTEQIIGTTRWHVLMLNVFKRESDGKLFMTRWRKAATEMQEHELPKEAHECEAYTETVTQYRKVA